MTYDQTIELANWRNPRPATDLTSWFENIERNALTLLQHAQDFFPLYLPLIIAVGLFLGLAYAKKPPARLWIGFWSFAILGVAMAVVHYVITSYHGILISHRSVFAVHFGVIVVLWGFTFLIDRRLVVLSTFVLVAIPSLYLSVQNVHWFSRVTGEIRKEVLSVAPKPLDQYDIVEVDAREFKSYFARQVREIPEPPDPFFEGFATPLRWLRVLTHQEARQILICASAPFRSRGRGAASCPQLLAMVDRIQRCDRKSDLICALESQDRRRLLLRLIR